MLGTPQGMRALDDCDTLLMLGSDFPYSQFLPTHKKIIQIDIRPEHLGKRCPVSIGIIGHLEPAMKALEPLLIQRTDNEFLIKMQTLRQDWDQKMNKKADPLRGKENKIPPQAVTRMACDLADDDAIFIADVGLITGWTARHMRMRGTQRLLGSFNHGSLGVALPAAIGVQLLDRTRQVIAMAGDGGFNMMMQDFITAVRYELPITFIVYNNQKLGFVEVEMQASGMPKYGTKLLNPDFAAIAEACGGQGITVTQPSEFKNSLKQAYASEKPTILDVMVNPDELLMPPKIGPAQAWGFSVAKIKEVFVEDENY
jgi:pyruvate dehydrogenase (quinone)